MLLHAGHQSSRAHVGPPKASTLTTTPTATVSRLVLREATARDAPGDPDHLDVEALAIHQPEPAVDLVPAQVERLLGPEREVLAEEIAVEPASLAGAGWSAAQAMTTVAPMSPWGDACAPTTAPRWSRSSPIAVVLVTRVVPRGIDRLLRQPGVELRAVGGGAVEGRLGPGLGPHGVGHRLGAGGHHGGAPGDPPLDRGLLPPPGDGRRAPGRRSPRTARAVLVSLAPAQSRKSFLRRFFSKKRLLA